MGIYLLDKAYRNAGTGPIPFARVVVAADNPGECRLPATANAGAILGIAVTGQTIPGRALAVRKAGIAQVLAAGAIPYGAPVVIAGNTGKVRAITEAEGTTVQCVGFAETAALADGDLIDVFVSIHERTA
jgi:hypothetical protein